MNNEVVSGIRSLIGFFVLMMLLIMIVAALIFIFWIWMIIDCARRQFKNDTDKIVWILVIIFLNVLGAAIYYFVVKVNDKKSRKNK